LLSRLLAAHPAVLSLSEVFSAAQPGALPSGEVAAERFWDILSRPQPFWTMALQHSLEPDEFAYPIDRGGRFDRQTGVAPIAAVCLPGISNEPDRLYGELEAVVRGFPAAEVGVLYRTLFDWLVDRQGARVWVERSGGSLAYCGEIAAHFKDARFVHVYRDGCETALSMSRHPFFRLAVARGTLTRKLDYDSAIPLEVFGRRWSAMILHGTGALKRQNADVWHVSYEDLISTRTLSCEGSSISWSCRSRPRAGSPGPQPSPGRLAADGAILPVRNWSACVARASRVSAGSANCARASSRLLSQGGS
jgi:hypothetical protein